MYILILALMGISFVIYQAFGLRRAYLMEVQSAFVQNDSSESEILTEEHMMHLPEPVQRYMQYTGVVGKEKIRNFKLKWEGEFKTDKSKDWVKSRAEQYNFIENPQRFYFMTLIMAGIPVVGLHVYKDAMATMRIKIAGLMTVGDAKGDIMNKAETVTVLNDMCLMAPGTLVDPRIEWETIDPLTVKATFNNKETRISATLHFNDRGELVNFVSNDRYMTATGNTYQNAPWSTPMGDYRTFNGVTLASRGEAIWSLPEGDLCYGKFNLKEVSYNLKS